MNTPTLAVPSRWTSHFFIRLLAAGLAVAAYNLAILYAS